ncbi:hypothetical protein BB394_06145 [Helicobacter pylori]|nr:hypothetical protein BB394_06145 [Helicobacter pylori]
MRKQVIVSLKSGLFGLGGFWLGVVGEVYFKIPPYSFKEMSFYLRNGFYHKIKSNQTNFLKNPLFKL